MVRSETDGEEAGRFSRRTILWGSSGLVAMLAGCSSGETSTGTPTTESPTPSPTPTKTPTATERPLPTIEEFEYPDGATPDGVSPTVVSGHVDTITEAGSVTLTEEGERKRADGFSTELDATKQISSAGVLHEQTSGDVTEQLWAPTSRSKAYVQMDAGFEQRYRIEQAGPSPDQALESDQLRALLRAGEWDGVTEIVEQNGKPVAQYHARGAADEQSALEVLSGNSLETFEATLSLTQEGYVSQYEYEIAVTRRDQTTTLTLTASFSGLGETDVSEPDWFDIAVEEGYEFTPEVTEDKQVAQLDVANGPPVEQLNVQLSTRGGFATGRISEPISEGDTLYLSYAGEGSLTYGINERPEETSTFESYVFVSFREGNFTLFEESLRV